MVPQDSPDAGQGPISRATLKSICLPISTLSSLSKLTELTLSFEDDTSLNCEAAFNDGLLQGVSALRQLKRLDYSDSDLVEGQQKKLSES